MINPIVILGAAALASLGENRQHHPYTITLGPERDPDLFAAEREIQRQKRMAELREDRAARREQLLAWQRERQQPIISAAEQKRARKNARRAAALYSVKIVPDADPNADGEWVSVQAGKDIRSATFADACRRLASQIPAGHHIVATGGAKK